MYDKIPILEFYHQGTMGQRRNVNKQPDFHD